MEHIEALSKWKPGAAEFHRFEKHLDVLNRDSSDIRHLIELVDDKLNRLPKPQEPRGSSLIEGLRFIRDWKAAHADVLARTEELNVIREALQEHSSDNIDVILLVSGRFTDAADAHMRFSIAQLEQQGLLKDMFVELHIYASAVLPEESLLKTFLDKLIWRKGEDTTEYLVKMAVDDLGTLMSQFVPLASIFIHSFKDWRKRKVSLEEWVAGVKGLILIRSIISEWDTGGIQENLLVEHSPPTSESISQPKTGSADKLGALVSLTHARWEEDKSFLESYLSAGGCHR